MFKIIDGLPKNILGIEARGKVTDADYKRVLIPQVNKMLAKNPSIRVLYVAGKNFRGYDTRAMWDDAVLGLNHWTSFSAIAIVTDVDWLRTVAHLLSPLFPGVIRVFGLADLPAAKSWIVNGKNPTRKKKPDALKKEIVMPLLYDIDHAVRTAEKRMEKSARRTAKSR